MLINPILKVGVDLECTHDDREQTLLPFLVVRQAVEKHLSVGAQSGYTETESCHLMMRLLSADHVEPGVRFVERFFVSGEAFEDLKCAVSKEDQGLRDELIAVELTACSCVTRNSARPVELLNCSLPRSWSRAIRPRW